jgi:hypothetical protein
MTCPRRWIEDSEFFAGQNVRQFSGFKKVGSASWVRLDSAVKLGDRGFYFKDPNGHLLEVMTVPETGS